MQPDIIQPPIRPAHEHPPVGHSYQPPSNNDKKKRREGIRSVVSTILILVAAPLIAVLLTIFVFQSYEVDGPSMETTLQNQDRLVVLKTGKTWASLTNKHFIPGRGEIVVFNRADEGGRQLIKRVIGLPGERVVVHNGRVTVYNKEFPDGLDPDNNASYRNNINPVTAGEVDVVVPEGEVFVAGDNRANSLDSRSFGTIASDDIVGTLVLRLYPFNKFDTF